MTYRYLFTDEHPHVIHYEPEAVFMLLRCTVGTVAVNRRCIVCYAPSAATRCADCERAFLIRRRLAVEKRLKTIAAKRIERERLKEQQALSAAITQAVRLLRANGYTVRAPKAAPTTRHPGEKPPGCA